MMGSWSDRFLLSEKISLFSLVLTLVGVIGIAFMAYDFADTLLQNKAREALSQKMTQEGSVLSRVLKTVGEDARLLSELAAVQGMSHTMAEADFEAGQGPSSKGWQERLTKQMFTLLKQRDMYYQIRLIGIKDNGLELIRVARLEQGLRVISQSKLQEKGHRKYFVKALKLRSGEVSFSGVSLNKEYGEITLPPRPMLRVIVPACNDKGENFAFFVINVSLKGVAQSLHYTGRELSYFIANDKGDYLIHPDEYKAMAFEYGRVSSVQLDYPELIPSIKAMRNAAQKTEVISFDLSERGVVVSLFHLHYDDLDHEKFMILGAEESIFALQEASLKLRNQLLLIVLLLALLLAVITFFVVRHLTRPIIYLKQAVNRVAEGEDVVIPVGGDDEIASLGLAFKLLLAKLAASTAKLEQAKQGLEQEVDDRTTELQQAKQEVDLKNTELVAALEQAQQAVRAKSQFLATMSHEIRTPLNGVLGLTELVLESHLTAQQRDHLEVVFASGETLLTILNDILDFSKMEAGQFELSYCEFSVNDLVEHITKLYSKTAETKGIELIVESIPKLNHLLIGDPDRLRQVLMNLLSNAVKFTAQGEVFVQATLLDESNEKARVRFSVKDTGIGISQQNQQRLFEDFSQLDASHARKYGGTGLGLSIAQRLIGLMGSKVCVESCEGEGSRFWFDIDFEKGAVQPDMTLNHASLLKQWRVLVVDDNTTNLQVMQGMLDVWGSPNHAVERGQAGLTCLLEAVVHGDPFQLALIDHMMPEMDGRELALRIKQEPKLKDLKVVMLSSLDDVFDMHTRKACGLDGFLRKPVHHSALYNIMISVMHDEAYQVAEARAVVGGRGERILLVEDVEVNQKVALGMLKTKGFSNVDVANNGLEALQLFSCGKYALILMDLQMPEMDGYTATHKIRLIEQTEKTSQRVPIIALTAHAFSDERKQSLDIGMDDLLTKPLTGKKLAEAVHRWLAVDEVSAVEDAALVAEPVVPACPSLDGDVLRHLSVDMGGGIGELLDMFTSALPAQIDDICQAVHDGEVKALKEAAHRLKGTSRNMGALALGALCQQLEDEAKDVEAMERDVWCSLLRSEADTVLHAFTASWLQEVR